MEEKEKSLAELEVSPEEKLNETDMWFLQDVIYYWKIKMPLSESIQSRLQKVLVKVVNELKRSAFQQEWSEDE